MASANVPLRPAQRRLLALLGGLRPSQTICLADMTNTLLRQSLDDSGYPEEAKRLHRAYLAQGGALVVVTGDSRAVVREQFLDRLAFGGGDLFIVSGSGHLIDAVWLHMGGTRLVCLHRGPDLAESLRRELLYRLIACLEDIVGKPEKLWLTAAESQLFSNQGARIDVSPHYPQLHDTSFIEVVPNKVTCYFPSAGRSRGIAARVLDRIAADDQILALAKRADAHVVWGPNFVDILTSDKGSGLDTLAGLSELERLRPEERTLIVLGDSINDHPMFTHTGLPCRRRILVYLGGDDPPAVFENEATSFVHLVEQHVAGAMFVFAVLMREITS